MHKLLIGLLLVSNTAFAYDYVDNARVVDAEPLYGPQQPPRCWEDHVQTYEQDTYEQPHSVVNAGTVIGAVAGGIIGAQVGRGNGKTAATAVGAAVGAMTGNAMNQGQEQPRSRPSYRTVQRCDPVTEPVPTGYRITYLYNGREFTRTVRNYPGASVRVGVELVED